jgi:hypothetical protein
MCGHPRGRRSQWCNRLRGIYTDPLAGFVLREWESGREKDRRWSDEGRFAAEGRETEKGKTAGLTTIESAVSEKIPLLGSS